MNRRAWRPVGRGSSNLRRIESPGSERERRSDYWHAEADQRGLNLDAWGAAGEDALGLVAALLTIIMMVAALARLVAFVCVPVDVTAVDDGL